MRHREACADETTTMPGRHDVPRRRRIHTPIGRALASMILSVLSGVAVACALSALFFARGRGRLLRKGLDRPDPPPVSRGPGGGRGQSSPASRTGRYDAEDEGAGDPPSIRPPPQADPGGGSLRAEESVGGVDSRADRRIGSGRGGGRRGGGGGGAPTGTYG